MIVLNFEILELEIQRLESDAAALPPPPHAPHQNRPRTALSSSPPDPIQPLCLESSRLLDIPTMPPSTFNAKMSADQAAAEFASSIAGKTVLVTGASLGGLGGETCRAVAKSVPGLLILAGRSAAK